MTLVGSLFLFVSTKASLTLFPLPANSFTPWFKLIAESFLYQWWDKLMETRPAPESPLDARTLVPHIEARKAEMGEIIRM